MSAASMAPVPSTYTQSASPVQPSARPQRANFKAPALPPIPRAAPPLQVAFKFHLPNVLRYVLLRLACHLLQLRFHILLRRRLTQALLRAAELLTLHETTYGDDAGNPPSAYGGIPIILVSLPFVLVRAWAHQRDAGRGRGTRPQCGGDMVDNLANAYAKSTMQAREGDVDEGPWPAQFHAAFCAQVWCTYRAGFEPIRDLSSPATLPPPLSFPAPSSSNSHSNATSLTPNLTNSLHAAVPRARARRPPSPSGSSYSSVGARVVIGAHRVLRILQIDFDVPVRCFGDAQENAALRMLVDVYPVCGLGVSVATDGMCQTGVFAMSHSRASSSRGHGVCSPGLYRRRHSHGTAHGHGHAKPETRGWGDRPVLLLLGIRLGLDTANLLYHETIKMCILLPFSVISPPPRRTVSSYIDSFLHLPHYALNLPAIRGHCGRSPFALSLLCRRAGNKHVYLDPHPPSRSFAALHGRACATTDTRRPPIAQPRGVRVCRFMALSLPLSLRATFHAHADAADAGDAYTHRGWPATSAPSIRASHLGAIGYSCKLAAHQTHVCVDSHLRSAHSLLWFAARRGCRTHTRPLRLRRVRSETPPEFPGAAAHRTCGRCADTPIPCMDVRRVESRLESYLVTLFTFPSHPTTPAPRLPRFSACTSSAAGDVDTRPPWTSAGSYFASYCPHPAASPLVLRSTQALACGLQYTAVGGSSAGMGVDHWEDV
ncbi:hypothetical protein DFH09DRAFT_1461520 [Mycena vulgaris]|nr:hypothetical protein DFH09DRAFT_1461520 [Mycena vulgaris]